MAINKKAANHIKRLKRKIAICEKISKTILDICNYPKKKVLTYLDVRKYSK